jgi:P pilus assembly chaperone PapD
MKKLLIIALNVSLLVASFVPAVGHSQPMAKQPSNMPTPRVGFSPARFELDWNGKGSTESLAIINVSDKPLSVTVAVKNWDLDENNRTRNLPPTEQSLDQWIMINPLSFSIDPGSRQTLRFSIRPKVKPAPGEHRAMIYISEIPEPGNNKEDEMSFTFNFGLPVYLHVGKEKRTGELHGTDIVAAREGHYVALDFESTGTAYARLDASYASWKKEEYPGIETAISSIAKLEKLGDEEKSELPYLHGELAGTPVLPGYRRKIYSRLETPAVKGEYITVVAGKIGEVDVVKELSSSF